jgi:hypothetical protein
MKTREDNPHKLPPRLYERRGIRSITWWTKDVSGSTRTINQESVSATEDKIAAARNIAIASFLEPQKIGKNNKGVRSVRIRVKRINPNRLLKLGDMPAWAWSLFRYSHAKANERGIPWMITASEFSEIAKACGGKCSVSGVQLRISTERARGPYGPSVDRIDSSLAYTKDNVRIVCVAANFAMNTWGLEAFIPIAIGIAETAKNSGRIPATAKSLECDFGTGNSASP